jgi:hypothetical protein
MTVAVFLRTVWLPVIRTSATRSGEPRRRSTIASYETAVEKWIIPHIGRERLESLTPQDIERMLADLANHGGKDGRPAGTRTRQYAYDRLRSALDLAIASLLRTAERRRAGRPAGAQVPRDDALDGRPGAAVPGQHHG